MYKDTMSLADKGLLGMAAIQFDNIGEGETHLLDSNTRDYWKARLLFGNSYQSGGACYFQVVDSVLSQSVPVGFPNSSKLVDEVETQMTWSEYVKHTAFDTDVNYIHAGAFMPNGNRANAMEFSEFKLYVDELGIANLKYQHEYVALNEALV